MRAAIIAGCLALAACATPYQDMGYRGGVKVIPTGPHEFIVQSRGNAYTDKTMVVLYAARRAAEQAIANGDDWVMLKKSADDDRTSTEVVPGSSTSYTTAHVMGTGYGAMGSATTNTFSTPGYVQTYFKPGSIMGFVSGKGDPPPHARDARELLNYLVPATSGR